MSFYDRYHAVTTAEHLRKVVSECLAAEWVAIDTEGTSRNPEVSKLVGLSLCASPESAYYVPFGHTTGEPQLSWEEVRELLQPLKAHRGIVGQNLTGYDLVTLDKHDLVLPHIGGDTLVAAFMLEPLELSRSLDALALRHLGVEMISFTTATQYYGGRFENVPIPQATRYAAEDAHITLLLHTKFLHDLNTQGMLHTYLDVEAPLVRVLASMRVHGVLVDANYLHALDKEFAARLKGLMFTCWTLAGRPFNLNSPQQLSNLLYHELGLPIQGYTAAGQKDTSADALLKLSDYHPVVRTILDARGLSKLVSTYTSGLPPKIDSSGRIHTVITQVKAETGRLASKNPNLQNIPIRTADGRRLREAFVAPDGCVMMSADYSQVELRILAHMLQKESTFSRAFRNGVDVHALTASEMFGLPLENVTADIRREAKAINFGLLFGQTAFGLAKTLRCERAYAEKALNRYKTQYPEVDHYMRTCVDFTRRTGYAVTLMGRRRPLPGIFSSNHVARGHAQRAATNTPIQGSAADVIKVAMRRVHDRLANDGLRARMVLQVHDELLLEVPTEEVETVRNLVRHEMMGAADLLLPLDVEIGVGPTWGSAH